jgi:uncharacterized protein (TIGR03546 family)
VFNRKKWQKRLKVILSLDNHPGHIAAGFAVGVFISCTPFYGLHTLLAIVAAFVFRLNKLTCITGSWVNTPLTVIPITALSYKIGRVLLGRSPQDLQITKFSWQFLMSHASSLILGSSILGFCAAVISYFLCYYLVVRFRRKDVALAEMTREMEEVGEELE